VSPPLAQDQAWGDYFLDDDEFDAEDFARAIELEQDWRFMAEPPAAALPAMGPRLQTAPAAAAPVQQAPQPADIAEPKDECVQMVAAVFPGICLDHVSDLYDKIAKASERLIAHVLDQMDKGIIYPKAKDKAKDLKRKRDIDEDEEAARKYGAPDRVISAQVGGIRPYM
jgi:TRIAD3 protein (E3 ubiquitin-protein ligase RNF216)